MSKINSVKQKSFDFWRCILLVECFLFAVQAVTWIFIGGFDPFGFYEKRMAQAFWNADFLPPDARKAFEFSIVLLGATTAGFFVLVYSIVKHAFPKREFWAYRAVIIGILVWFTLDTAFGLWHKAYFNILIVNLPCLFLLGVPLFAIRRHFISRKADGSDR